MHHFSRIPCRLRRLRSSAVLVAVLGCLLLAGCGDDNPSPDDRSASGSPSDGSDAGFPIEVRSGPSGDTKQVSVHSRPHSIVSLSPTATETLWAIDAGDQVVAVDDQSDYPAGVPTTKLSGYRPNVEAILGYEPDLVVASDDSDDLVAGLKAAGVPTLLLPSANNLDEAYSQMERLGAATGHVAEAAQLVAHVRTGIEQAVSAAPDVEGLTYFHELDPTLYTAGGDTFIGEVYGLFGLTSIADAAPGGDDYPQLSSEYVVDADPDFVFLADADCCDVSVDKVGSRAGWDKIAAVRNDHVEVMDEDIASRWGPRVVDFAKAVGHLLSVQHSAGAPSAH